MDRALVLCRDGPVGAAELGGGLTAQPPIHGALYGSGFKTARTREMRDFEARYLRDQMETNGNARLRDAPVPNSSSWDGC